MVNAPKVMIYFNHGISQQTVLGCFFGAGLESFAGCVQKSAEKSNANSVKVRAIQVAPNAFSMEEVVKLNSHQFLNHYLSLN
jgi:hypothetical protein